MIIYKVLRVEGETLDVVLGEGAGDALLSQL